MITPLDALDQLDELDLDDAQTAAFLGENARRVFALDG
jgi:predicted TIM-barrel fold metal-dependent hydrolase